MDDQQIQTAQSPIYQESQQKNAKWLWLLIFIIIIAALTFAFIRGIGPFAQFKSSTSKIEESPIPSVSSINISSPSPQASPEAKIDKSSAKIRVLNGSGKAGLASAVKDFLEGKGYKIVAIGNADSYDFEKTVIRLKKSFEKFEEALTRDLSDKYSPEVADENLEATDSADIEIIVGSK